MMRLYAAVVLRNVGIVAGITGALVLLATFSERGL